MILVFLYLSVCVSVCSNSTKYLKKVADFGFVIGRVGILELFNVNMFIHFIDVVDDITVY